MSYSYFHVTTALRVSSRLSIESYFSNFPRLCSQGINQYTTLKVILHLKSLFPVAANMGLSIKMVPVGGFI